MKLNSDRLTLRNVYPNLKKALLKRGEEWGMSSMEKTIIKILEQELAPELKGMEEQSQPLVLQPV